MKKPRHRIISCKDNSKASVKSKPACAAATPCFEVDVQSIHGMALERALLPKPDT